MEDGKLHFNESHDVSGIIEGVRERHLRVQHTTRNHNGASYLGSVDSITANNWAKQCGAAVGTTEFNTYAKKMLMSGAYAKFRAGS